MVRVPAPIVMMDRDDYLSLMRNDSSGLETQPDQPAEIESAEDNEIATLREQINALQADLAIKEEELQALIVKTLAGEKKE